MPIIANASTLNPASARRYLTTVEAAEHLNVSKSFLDKARLRDDGPPFIRIGGAIRYAVEDLDAFATARRVGSTSAA